MLRNRKELKINFNSGLITALVADGYPTPPMDVITKCLSREGAFIPFGSNRYRLKLFNNVDGSQVVHYCDNSGKLQAGNHVLSRPEKPLTPAQRTANAKSKAESKKAETMRKDAALQNMQGWIKNYRLCNKDNTYLKLKGITDIIDLPLLDSSLTDTKGNLVICYRNTAGQLRTIQTITSNGGKFFAKDLDKAGHFHLIMQQGRKLADCAVVFMVEGYANGASIYQSMAWGYEQYGGIACIVAGDVGNLEPVLLNLWQKLGDFNLIAIADNDTHDKDGKQRADNKGVDTWRNIIAKYPDRKIALFIPEDFRGLKPNQSFDVSDLFTLYGSSWLASEIINQCQKQTDLKQIAVAEVTAEPEISTDFNDLF